MASNDYHFVTHWRVAGTVEEVYAIISDARDLVRWWPAVYLDVQELPPDATLPGTGNLISLYTRGWLPYTLRWQFRLVEAHPPSSLTLCAWGDFDGRGIWTFVQEGAWVAITYDWQIRANKPLLRYLSFVFKPIFAANHRWAMRMGEASLKLELARRHAPTSAERNRVPPPPAPMSLAAFLRSPGTVATIGTLVAGLLLYCLQRRATFRRSRAIA